MTRSPQGWPRRARRAPGTFAPPFSPFGGPLPPAAARDGGHLPLGEAEKTVLSYPSIGHLLTGIRSVDNGTREASFEAKGSEDRLAGMGRRGHVPCHGRWRI